MEDLILDAATIDCPFPYLDKLRNEEPVFFSPSLNAYVVTRYEDCQKILDNPELFSSMPPDAINMMANFATAYVPIYTSLGVPPPIPALVTTDGAVHRRYRNAVDRSFNATSVRNMEQSITQNVNSLIDSFIDAGRVDIYEQFCMRLPLSIICDMLGLPHDRASLLRRSADAMARLAGGAGETQAARVALHRDQAEFHQYLLPLIHRTRLHPDETLISKLIHTPTDDGSMLTDGELMSIITTLNVGGNETTTNGLGNMFWLCFRDPELQQKLRSNTDLIDRFVEESLRLETPVAAMPRWVKRDAVIGDVKVPAGAAIHVSFSGANRDPHQFGCPTAIDPARTGIRNHLAFGKGPHYCLGAMLSRLELKISLRQMLERLDDIRVEKPDEDLKHQYKVIVRGFVDLPITFRRRGAAQ